MRTVLSEPALAGGDLLQGPVLPDHLVAEVVVPRPPQGVLVGDAAPGYLLVLRGEAGLRLGLDEDEAAGGWRGVGADADAGAAGARADRRALGLRLDGAEAGRAAGRGGGPPWSPCISGSRSFPDGV